MATKKSSGTVGGILGFLGALVYLYVIFAWYGSNGAVAAGSWLAAAQFLTPFVIAIGIFGALSLFFVNLRAIAGKAGQKDSGMMLWKWITWTGVAALIITGGGQFFWWAVIGVILTMLGGAWEMLTM